MKLDDKIIIRLNESVAIEKYEWFRNGVKKSEGQFLLLNGINQQQDGGIYRCQIILKNTQVILGDSFNLTATENIKTPKIVSATLLNETRIYLKWEPNRETTENTRYRIEVIYKDKSIPSFFYPGNFFIRILYGSHLTFDPFD
jgi:hypothetical protein